MANSLGGINLADVAQRTLEALTPMLFNLGMFCTDFSDEMANPAASITTRVPTTTEAEDVSGGFTADNSTSLPVTIPLNKELGKAIAFSQFELTTGGIDKVLQTFIPVVVNAVGLGVVREAIKLMTAANFANVSTVAAAAFDADATADLANVLDETDVFGLDRYLLVKPAWYNNVAKDNAVQSVDASGSDEALRQHRIQTISGFRFDKFNGFPTSGTTSAENLSGFCGHKSSIVYAARMPVMTDAGREVVDVEEVVDPATGFPMQFQQFYVPKERKHYFAIATLFGVSVGLAAAGRRIRSAAP